MDELVPNTVKWFLLNAFMVPFFYTFSMLLVEPMGICVFNLEILCRPGLIFLLLLALDISSHWLQMYR